MDAISFVVDHPGVPITLAVGIAFVLLARWRGKKGKRGKQTTPPGPERSVLFGYTLNFPRDHFYNRFSEWNRQFGDVVYANFLGRSALIISSREKAEELLNKRGMIYSNRPARVLSQKLMGWAGWNIALIQPGKRHAELRGLLLKGLSPSMVISYDPLVEKIIERQILLPLAQSGPEGCDPAVFIEDAMASILTEIAYGDSLTEEQRKELLHANQVAVRAGFKIDLTSLLLDVFPILRYYPGWLPGGGFQRWAADARVFTEYVRYKPWETVLIDTHAGIKRNSLASRLVELNGPTDTVRDAVAFLYAAGAETTASTILIGVFVLLMYPEVQAKAHAEFDTVIGHDRPPTTEDRLPYMEAVWKEVLRWHPPAPLNIPHLSSQEDVWDGYHIPKGTVVYANLGAMLRNPQVWDDPEAFHPDRFLGNAKPGTFDPQSVVFGFGRRLCPGKALADRNGFNSLAAILWAFHIDPLPGEDRPTPTTARFVDSLASPPVPFRCVFTPRSEKISMACVKK